MSDPGDKEPSSARRDTWAEAFFGIDINQPAFSPERVARTRSRRIETMSEPGGGDPEEDREISRAEESARDRWAEVDAIQEAIAQSVARGTFVEPSLMEPAQEPSAPGDAEAPQESVNFADNSDNPIAVSKGAEPLLAREDAPPQALPPEDFAEIEEDAVITEDHSSLSLPVDNNTSRGGLALAEIDISVSKGTEPLLPREDFTETVEDAVIDEDPSSEPLLTKKNASRGGKTRAENGASRLCGMKKKTACIVIALSPLLVAGITLGVIYGRPPNWKLVGTMEESGRFEGLAISGDGTTIALRHKLDQQNFFGVKLIYPDPGEELAKELGQNAMKGFDPFRRSAGQYPLPANSEFGEIFEPSSVSGDIALDDTASTLVVLGHAILRDKWRPDEQKYRGLCNDGTGDITSRHYYGFTWCSYQRVATYKRNDDGIWEDKPFGRPIESFLARSLRGGPAAISLSGNGKTLSIGYQGSMDSHLGTTRESGSVRVYERDDGTSTKWKQVGEPIRGGNGGFGTSVSLNEDGSRIAIGGFETSHVAVYARRDGSWRMLGDEIKGDGTGDFGLTVSLSHSGNRVAAVARDHPHATRFDDAVPSDERDAARVQVFELDEGSETWSKLGNDITGFNACCSDSDAGHGVMISGDGSTVVVGSALRNDDVQPYRFDSGGSWKPMGKKLTAGASASVKASVSSDGNTVATAEYVQGTGQVKLYAFRRGL